MDPTTKEGRAELRGCHIAMQREHDIAKENDRTPSSAPQVRWLTATGDHMLAALSHIDNLERERDDLWERIERHGTSYSDMLHRAADETSRLRAELERAREALQAFIAWMDDSRTPGHAVNPVRYMAHCDLLDVADRLARAALANPSETPSGSPAPYEPSDAEMRALGIALGSCGVHVTAASLRAFLIAAANARRML